MILFILFLIYISRVFNKVLETSFLIILLFFINNLGFITSDSLIKKIIKTFEKITKKVIILGMLNTVTYNILKIKIVLFSRSS